MYTHGVIHVFVKLLTFKNILSGQQFQCVISAL